MEKKIVIFKSREEQEDYGLEQMRRTTVHERFESLYRMQQWTLNLRPVKPSYKIVIRDAVSA